MVAFENGQFLNLLGLALFFAQVQILRMLQLNRGISVLSATLSHRGEDLGQLAVILIVYLTAFAVIALSRTPTFETWTQTSNRPGLEMVLKRSVTGLRHSLQWSVTGL